MGDATEGKLQQAYDLIGQDRLDDAAAVLRPLLIDEPSNADVWWLWANAVTEPEDARHALQRVLQLEPEHGSAEQLLERLNELYPPVLEAAVEELSFGEASEFDDLLDDTIPQELAEAPEITVAALEQDPYEPAEAEAGRLIRGLAAEADDDQPTAVDFGWLDEEELEPVAEDWDVLPDIDESGFLSTDDLEEDLIEPGQEEVPEATPRKRVLRPVLLFLLIIAVIVAAVVLSSNFRQSESPVATDVAAQPQNTDISDTMQIVLEAAESAANAQQELLGGPASASLEMQGDGAILMIRVCRSAGTDLTSAMNIAMEMAARYGVSAQDELAATGVVLENCTRNDILLSATAPIEESAAFANGNRSQHEFRTFWQWVQ